MLDLEEQIREYVGFLDHQTRRVSAEAAIERGSSARRAAISRRSVIVASAATAVAVAIGSVVVLGPFGAGETPFVEDPTSISTATTGSAPTSTEVAPTTTGAATTTTAPVVAEVPVIRWERIYSDAFSAPGPLTIEEVIVGGPGLVAVGTIWSEPATGVIWYSTDGETWTRVPHDEQIFGEASIRAVTPGGPGFVAVGSVAGPDGDGAAAVWVSEDGITWSRVPHDEAVFGGPALEEMLDVTAGGPGLVAVGWENPLEGWDASAAVWTSTDGLTWERVRHDENTFGGTRMQMMWAVTTDGSRLVAGGHDGLWSGSGGPGQPAAVWISPDGLTWTRVSHQEQLTTGRGGNGDWAVMHDVIAGGPGFVGVGRIGWCSAGCDETGAAWTSVDGNTWQRSQVEQAVGIPYTHMNGVVEFAGMLVGVGRGFDPASGRGPAVLWMSLDNGESWMRQPHSGARFGKVSEGPVTMNTVIEFGSELIAVGYWEDNAAVWIGTIEN